jgi:hypothetical protein
VTNPAGVLVVDTVPPTAGTLALASFTDSGASTSDFISTDHSFDLSLTGNESGSTVDYEVSTDGGDIWTTLTTPAQIALADGGYEFRAQVSDLAGNTSTSNVVSVTVDTTAPVAPTVDGLITPDTTPTITGTATLAAGEQLAVAVHGATYNNVTVTGGVWSIDTEAATPSIGTLGAFIPGIRYDVAATVTDAAGNTTSDTTTDELFITDATPPTVSSVVYGSNDGTLRAGETVSFTVTFSEPVIVAEGAPILRLNNGGTATFTGGSGTNALTFSYTVEAGHNTTDLAVTAFDLRGSLVQDAQGNNADTTGAVSNPAGVLVVDTVPPTAGTLALASFTDSGDSDFVTNDHTFDLSLTGHESDSTEAYEVSTDGGDIWTTLTTPAQIALADGSYQFRAQVSDLAGNTNTSNVVSVTVDTTAPTTPTVNALSTPDTTPVISGFSATLGAGEHLTVTVNGATYNNVPVSSGVWSIDTETATPSSGTTLGTFIPGTRYDE